MLHAVKQLLYLPYTLPQLRKRLTVFKTLQNIAGIDSLTNCY